MSSVVVKCYPLLEGFEDLSQNEDLNVIIYCSAVESKSGESSDEDEDNMEAGADTGEENGKEGKGQDNKEKSKDKSDEGTICDFLFIVYFQEKQS